MMKRVLFSAFSCLPNRGSEPGVGWNWAVQAARNPDLNVSVLTREKCRPKIERELSMMGMKNLDFIYVPSSAKLRRLSIYLEYIKWQYDAYKYIKRNYGPDDFDCVWHTTFGNVFLPIWTHKLPYKFIWGPMGGGEHVPKRFYQTFSFKDALPHRIKMMLIRTAHINPVVQDVAKRSCLILSRTEETKALFKDSCKDKVVMTLETRMDASSMPSSCFKCSPIDGAMHVCYTGRLIALKNVKSLVEATVSLLNSGKRIVLHIVGDGPLEGELRSLAGQYADNGIVFHGQLNREEALAVVASCPVFVFPSLKEGGSWSLLEAMTLGRAIICFDASGMHEMLDDSSAILLPLRKPEDVASQFETALERFANNPMLVKSKGDGARYRARTLFCWDEVRLRTKQVVEKVCGC